MHRLIASAILAAAAAVPSTGAIAAEPAAPYAHTLYAIVQRVEPGRLIVQRRDGRVATVDVSIAQRNHRAGVLYPGRAVALHGDFDALHAFHAVSITGAAGIRYSPGAWPQDQ
jgi:hypothetical protein